MIIDKRTRFPVNEQVTSTSCRTTCDRLRKVFATHEIPERLESDNRPPFNSTDFRNFAEEMGFKHHRVTPEHPQTNGEAERFMKVLNKTEQIAHSEGRSSNAAIQYMLMGYRSTLHPATGYCPYEALMKRNVRTKLDYDSFSISRNYHNMEKEITNRDKEYKQKWDYQHRHLKVEKHQFKIGDRVLLKKRKQNKWSPAFEKESYNIIEISGSTIEAKRKSDGRTMQRDASKFKLFHEARRGDWRERLLRSSRHNQPVTPNTTEATPTQEGRNEETENEARQGGFKKDQNGNQQLDIETGRQANRRQEVPRRQLPQRTRRPPSKLKDYVVGYKKERQNFEPILQEILSVHIAFNVFT